MPYHIMYVNLKAGEKEEELIENLAKYETVIKKKVKGWKGFTVYKHYYFGENRRKYQIWLKFDNLSVIDAEIQGKRDPEAKAADKRVCEMTDIVNHIDECVSEVYPNRETPSSPL